MSSTKFWIEDPCILLSDLVFFPTANMTREQKLNALTRLAIVIGGVMYAMGYQHWQTFMLVSILIIIVIEYSSKARNNESFTKLEEGATTVENFTLVPTYLGDDFETTVVAPLFAEEHRVPPPAYDHYTVMDMGPEMPPFEIPDRPQAYPYGQYLTRSNMLPSDEYNVHMNRTGGARTAREYVNSAFTKNSMAFRENMTRLYKKKLNRRFRHNSNDTWSPFHSY